MTHRGALWVLINLLTLFILSVVVGSQSGWDYYNYQEIYGWQQNSDTILDRFEFLYAPIFFISSKEISFELFRGLEYFVSYLSYWIGLNIVYRNQKNKNLLAFLTILYFFDVFWGARQGLAIGVYLMLHRVAPLIALPASFGIHTGVGIVGAVFLVLKKRKITELNLGNFLFLILAACIGYVFIQVSQHPMLVSALTGQSYAETGQSTLYKFLKIMEIFIPVCFAYYLQRDYKMLNYVILFFIIGLLILFFPFLEVFAGRIFSIAKIIAFPLVTLSIMEGISAKRRNLFFLGFSLLCIGKVSSKFLSGNIYEYMYS